MIRAKKTTQIIGFLFIFQLLVGLSFYPTVSGQSNQTAIELSKISDDREGLFGDGFIGHNIAPDLDELVNDPYAGMKPVQVIIQTNGKELPRSIRKILGRNGIKIKKQLKQLGSVVVDLPVYVVRELAATGESAYYSLDSQVTSLGHLEDTTGAEDMIHVRGNENLQGTGIGIAILDTGIYKAHRHFLNKDKVTRVRVALDFTGEGITDTDPFGHGTHVAGLAAGSSDNTGIEGKFESVAPKANILNLRVLGADGSGSVSNVLSGLDWVLSNQATYNIRVVNLSLGALSVDSYTNDPLCRAVRRLVDAGIVVVAAAGNNGKDSTGQKIYGLIHSPGNEPSAITVGAVNSFGTKDRNDDVIATYSSRGPTRSYYTDTDGVKHYDNLIKPDLVAPGNRLISAQSAQSALVTSHPELNAKDPNDPQKSLMYLSGTSMAAPVVAGAAALILQANPTLTPNMVKAILMYTAQPLNGYNHFEQGAGEINIEGAVRLAKLIRTDLGPAPSLGTPFLTTATLPTPQSKICGDYYQWSQGIIMGYTFATGTELISQYQLIYGAGRLLMDGHLLSNGYLLSNAILLSNGITLGGNILTSDGHLLSNGVPFMSINELFADGRLLTNGVPFGNGTLMSDGHLLTNNLLLNDATSQANNAQLFGDPGGMSP